MTTKRAYFIRSPYDGNMLKNQIFRLMKMERDSFPYAGESLQFQVTSILQNIGIPAHLRGHKNLRIGILLAIKHPEYLSHIMHQLYPEIA